MNKELVSLEYDKILKRLSDHAVSECGKQYCLSLEPYLDINAANTALKETSAAESFLLQFGSPSLSLLSDVSGCCRRAQSGAVLTIHELIKIENVLQAVNSLHKYLEEHCTDDSVFAEKRDIIMPNKYLCDKLASSFSSEEEVSDTASNDLRDIRRKMSSCRERIKSSLDGILRNHSKYLQETIITIRNGRYVIPVKAEFRSEINGLVHDTSSSGATIFIEPMQVVQTNNDLFVLLSKEKNEIERILSSLSSEVGDFSDNIISGFEICRFFDFCFAKARYASEIRGCIPILNTDGFIRASMVRHPLIKKDLCVPIDITLGKEYTALIVTGPNTGGKTVSLKTTGLICLMAKSGLFIPAAAGADVAFFDKIFADIGDDQSIEQSLSTFSAHMSNIIYILNNLTANSLVLIDELGSGTDPVEGAALAIAIIEKTRDMGARIVCTSHYAELKLYALQSYGVENASCEFDVATLRPTYRLIIGIPGKSNAFAIARRLGLSEDVLTDAQSRLDAEDVKVENVLADLEINKKNAEAEVMKAEKIRNEAQQILDHAESISQDSELKYNNKINEAREQAYEIIERAKRDAESALDEIDKIRKEKEKENFKMRIDEGRSEIQKKLNNAAKGLNIKERTARPIDGNLKKGDDIRIVSLDKPAVAISGPDKNGMVTVQAGIIKTRVKIDDIERCKSKKVNYNIKPIVSTGVARGSRNVETELDIRGMTALEADGRIDEFLDNCSLCGLNIVSIIHGKGTGALRSAVHEKLRRCKLVDSFRLGVYGEGETGVTIVTLK